jgi:hypothetical protein
MRKNSEIQAFQTDLADSARVIPPIKTGARYPGRLYINIFIFERTDL